MYASWSHDISFIGPPTVTELKRALEEALTAFQEHKRNWYSTFHMFLLDYGIEMCDIKMWYIKLNTIDCILESTHEIIHVLNVSVHACYLYQLCCQSVIPSMSLIYCELSIHRLRLQEERELKRQQDLDYEESLRNDREKVWKTSSTLAIHFITINNCTIIYWLITSFDVLTRLKLLPYSLKEKRRNTKACQTDETPTPEVT